MRGWGVACLGLLACSSELTPDGGLADAALDAALDAAPDVATDATIMDSQGDAPEEDTGADAGVADAVTCEHTPMPESCFNDIDDDCDGLTDCADPDCGPTAECVPDVSGGFDLGTLVTLGGQCPAGYSGFKPDANNQIDPGVACTGCSCSPWITCETTIGDLGSNACPNGQVQKSFTIGKLCQDNGGMGLGFTSGKIKIDPVTATPVCNAAGNPSLPAYTWKRQSSFCTQSSKGGGCGANQACVARLSIGKHCARATGSMSCPAGYVAEGVGSWWTSGANDQRTCTACACSSQPQGGDCSVSKVLLLPQTGCLGNPQTEAFGTTDCNAPSTQSAWLSAPIMPTCSNSGASSSITGTVTPSGIDQTICCQ